MNNRPEKSPINNKERIKLRGTKPLASSLQALPSATPCKREDKRERALLASVGHLCNHRTVAAACWCTVTGFGDEHGNNVRWQAADEPTHLPVVPRDDALQHLLQRDARNAVSQAHQRELHGLRGEFPQARLDGLTKSPVQRLQPVAQDAHTGEEVELV